MAVDGNVHRGERGGVFPLEKCGQGVHLPVIAAAVLTVLPELLRSMNDYRMLIYAIVLIVVIRFRPSGILGWYMNSKVKTFIDEKILKKPSLDVLEEYELMADKRGK